MRALPAGECVGGEARMDKSQGRFHRGIGQIHKVFTHLLGHKHPLVNQCPGRNARRVPERVQARGPVFLVGHFSDHKELALEVHVAGATRTAGDEHLAVHRFAVQCCFSKGRVVGWHSPPSKHLLTVRSRHLLEILLALGADLRVGGYIQHSNRVMAGLWKADAETLGHLVEKRVGDLQENPRSVPGIHLASTGPAVIQVHQHGQGLLNNLVGSFTLHLANKSYAARIVLKLRVIQPLFLGKSGIIHFFIWMLVRPGGNRLDYVPVTLGQAQGRGSVVGITLM